MVVPRTVVVAGATALVVLALLVGFLVLHDSLVPTDAAYVASNPRWGACTQEGQTVHCVAIATVTNQGGSRVTRYQYLAFYLPDGTGCDADIPAIDPGVSRSLSCVVTMSSNFPPGSTGDQTPTDPPKAIVRQA